MVLCCWQLSMWLHYHCPVTVWSQCIVGGIGVLLCIHVTYLHFLSIIFISRGVPVLVDGAHALGILPLNLHELGADYYTTNCHKWFSAFKGCALLYVKRSLQSTVKPLVISHGFGHGFNSDFMWTGMIIFLFYIYNHSSPSPIRLQIQHVFGSTS